jgi:hypothetical protein
MRMRAGSIELCRGVKVGETLSSERENESDGESLLVR